MNAPLAPSHPLTVVVLAAGKGTRMKSQTPKVLQPLGGRAMLAHVLQACGTLKPRHLIAVTGHGATDVNAYIDRHRQVLLNTAQCTTVLQEPQNGTGHAVQLTSTALDDEAIVLITLGDVPLVQPASLQAVVALCNNERVALLTVALQDPTGYGRIVRNATGHVQAIVEHKDANEEQRAIREINSGIMAFPARLLKPWLAKLTNNNAQQEYYLTDVIGMAVADGVEVQTHCLPATQAWEVAGINSPAQLAHTERQYQQLQAQQLMEQGVRLADPARFDLRAAPGSALAGHLECANDVEIDVGCIFSGQVHIGAGSHIGAYCHISQASIGHHCLIAAYTHIDGETAGVTVGDDARIGPFARLRPGATLANDVHIGNFVEVKNSTLANGAKANHLAYLGDASVGERVNYGAGAITANYDGANKHKTVIEADVHVGSNSVLVAPVTVGAGGTIGAGSTISKDTPANSLTVTRAKAITVQGWSRPIKKQTR
ncbi:UDP-N-acetylglucosamine diphosphorylase/glucosamine-1-phosphate N-acetyltransferase [Lampropedia puyangensis]|uniref:Bifunctional protein GlmU n=1 Tax=Lampropedia puyangensis TaxID=1330072 RepID=A0A4S8EZZ6_9BURK|nr:bifunctional UDP-N-acetylglucosamine diphosphorylase/glucosamine-1-phosphate N-acetyltransferase GlmU [Lampropedia puyangensis]THT99930.1 UDP-N-acetylglucosamine diphosphorylase/glucosamine-1-phosphate N-acetyltransferase [Lampropedia puyangensis]